MLSPSTPTCQTLEYGPSPHCVPDKYPLISRCHALIQVPKDATFEEKIEHIISNSTVAIRIGRALPPIIAMISYARILVPVRPASYPHLRDAFLRTLRGRIQIARKQKDITPDQEDVSLPRHSYFQSCSRVRAGSGRTADGAPVHFPEQTTQQRHATGCV